jgi:hypothetical protein
VSTLPKMTLVNIFAGVKHTSLLQNCRIAAQQSFITLDCEGKKRNFCLKLFSKNPNFILKSSEPRLSELGSVPKINETFFSTILKPVLKTVFNRKIENNYEPRIVFTALHFLRNKLECFPLQKPFQLRVI